VPAKSVKTYFNEISTKKYSRKHKASEDDLFARHIHQLDRFIVPKIYDAKVWDLGCGYGYVQNLFELNSAAEIVFVDFAENALALAKQETSFLSAQKTFLCADITQYEFPHQDADIIICVNVVPYIDDINSLTQRVASLLKPGGLFLLVYPVASIVWEKQFEGITIKFHPEQILKHTFEQSGLRCWEKVSVQFTIPLLRKKENVAIVQLFEKEATHESTIATSVGRRANK